MNVDTLRRLAEAAALARTGLAFRAPGGTAGTGPAAVAPVAAMAPSARPGDAPPDTETDQGAPAGQENAGQRPGVTIELSSMARQIARHFPRADTPMPGDEALGADSVNEATAQGLPIDADDAIAASTAALTNEAPRNRKRAEGNQLPTPSASVHVAVRSPSAAGASPLDAASVPTPPGAPALTGTPTHVHELAGAIAETISNSGLFYESHLAEWVDGARTLGQIRTEPQNGGHPPLAVADQLQALSSGAIAWRGEVWPGQNGELMIGEEEQRATDTQPVTWHARIILELPELGRVEAHLALNGQRLDLRFATDTAAHRDTVAAATPGLLERMQAHGLAALARVETQPAAAP